MNLTMRELLPWQAVTVRRIMAASTVTVTGDHPRFRRIRKGAGCSIGVQALWLMVRMEPGIQPLRHSNSNRFTASDSTTALNSHILPFLLNDIFERFTTKPAEKVDFLPVVGVGFQTGGPHARIRA